MDASTPPVMPFKGSFAVWWERDEIYDLYVRGALVLGTTVASLCVGSLTVSKCWCLSSACSSARGCHGPSGCSSSPRSTSSCPGSTSPTSPRSSSTMGWWSDHPPSSCQSIPYYTHLYIMYPDRKGYISAPWGCFGIVNILFRSWDIVI